jgi:YggT family protein
MSNHTIDIIETWLRAFVDVYTILIIAWIISSWVRLPYNVWVSRVRTFLDDTVSPYVGVFRRFLPMFGPLDLSPMAAIIVLQVAERILQSVLDGFRPAG